MNNYRLLYFFWAVPAYLLFLVIQQGLVYQSSIDTYENGTTYLAEVTDFDIKQIAAQSNGYVDIRFETEDELIERRLSLSVQMAQELMKTNNIPIRYQKGAFQEIVLYPTFNIQKSTSLFNMSVAFIGLVVTVISGFFVNRYVRRKVADENDEKFEIERVD
ncbi:hypothetical protein [Gracilimonas sediminicola]|uniref:Uncharacterized protein n=1 Tax=Gracilimonas sediminicola TaxID=2952158 RepID=A0A9X2L4I6_9BACT|nr:hypothetical protein [Gracilimonas sediminicola]MCP9292072.1 hypothetical protein [Gracilimonas sediminicola]